LKDIGIPEHVTGTKKALLSAALELFAERGYGGVTITDIAKKAKVSKQLALYHYKEPKQFLIELAAYWGDTGRQVTLEHLSKLSTSRAVDKIYGMSDAMFTWMKKYPLIAKITSVLFQASSQSEEVNKIISLTLKQGVDRIEYFLKEGSHPKANVRETAQGIHSVMIGAALFIIGTNKWSDIDKYKETCRKAIKAIAEM
jgi:AcrR family transcriptional regulator